MVEKLETQGAQEMEETLVRPAVANQLQQRPLLLLLRLQPLLLPLAAPAALEALATPETPVATTTLVATTPFCCLLQMSKTPATPLVALMKLVNQIRSRKLLL